MINLICQLMLHILNTKDAFNDNYNTCEFVTKITLKQYFIFLRIVLIHETIAYSQHAHTRTPSRSHFKLNAYVDVFIYTCSSVPRICVP